ncbi:hypothetical protein M9H77_06393 [Catharanthus roseus]|uniref:Uncharacterized protein n=1 Tax=Catharanthus roseus TaxID=4058 RepID=A0ACC0BS01_CATRO|nr:hypothetical protein M9H77_06393 [Catharanthus roseus]
MQKHSKIMHFDDSMRRKESISNGVFPEDIWVDILVKLPVKSLVRFLVVSKTWKSLISNNRFAKLHLHRSKGNEQLLRVGINPKSYFPEISILNLHGSRDGEKNHLLGNISFPFPIKPFEEVVIDGSCNGLVVLRTKSILGIILCNLATRKFYHLQLIFNEIYPLVGLCYITETKDYQIVRIQNNEGKSNIGWIYSLNAFFWTRLNVDFPYIKVQHGESGMATIFNECMYWITDEDGGSIATFNVKNEAFKYISLPAFEGLFSVFPRTLGIINGSLSIIISISTEKYNLRFEVWKMNEHRDSWTKLYSFNDPFNIIVLPIGSWKDGSIIFKYLTGNREKVCSYDPSNEKLHHLCMSGSVNLQAINYVESMESVDGEIRRIS